MVNPFRRRLLIGALLLAAYWLTLFLLTHLPQQAVESVGHFDKVAHFGAYFGLALLLAWVMQAHEKPRLVRYSVALAIIACYGAIDEVLQGFVPGRTPDLRDWLADMAGAACGLLAHAVVVAALSSRVTK